MIRPTLALAAFLALAACASYRGIGRGEVDPAAIAKHVEVLSSDAYEGRAPGTKGARMATAYIAEAFRAAGLKPVSGTDFLVPVPLVVSRPEGGFIAAGDTALGNGETSFVRAVGTEPGVYEGDLVFAGYGIDAPDEERDDYGDADVQGKLVAVLAGPPPGADEGLRALSLRSTKIDTAIGLGARGVLLLYDAPSSSQMWRMLRGEIADAEVSIDRDGKTGTTHLMGVLSSEASAILTRALGSSVEELRQAAADPSFQAKVMGPVRVAVGNRVTRFSSANVAGFVPGHGRPQEYVVFAAHWDHLGRCAEPPDPICNGAVDNASGVGGLIELARAFAKGPKLKRSVLFLSTTFEEHGLLGVRYFLSDGPIKPAAMVAAFGLDTIAANGPSKQVTILGRGLTSLDKRVADAADEQGRRIAASPGAQGFYTRSDQYAFALAGVPAVAVTGIFESGGGFQDYMLRRYHRPSDETDAGIDYRGAVQDMELLLEVGRELANAERVPAWAKSSPYQRKTVSRP